MGQLITAMKNELILQNYSQTTIKSYTGAVIRLCREFNKSPVSITDSQLKDFLLKKISEGYSKSSIKEYVYALSFLYKHIYKSSRQINIKIPRRRKRIPDVLTNAEIKKIVSLIPNQKHSLLISLAYSSGLRISEVVRLKVMDINFYNLQIKIRNGKGKKDRITIFSKKLSTQLREQVKYKKAEDYVFPSSHGGHLHTRSAQKIFKAALQKSDIKRNTTFHSLRHSFATHLLQNGTDISHIQKLLGHSNIRTTLLYTKIVNSALLKVESPF